MFYKTTPVSVSRSLNVESRQRREGLEKVTSDWKCISICRAHWPTFPVFRSHNMFALPAFDTFLAFSIVRFQPPHLLSQLFNFSRTIILRPLLFCFPFPSFSHPGFGWRSLLQFFGEIVWYFANSKLKSPDMFTREGAREVMVRRDSPISMGGSNHHQLRKFYQVEICFASWGAKRMAQSLLQVKADPIGHIGECSLVSGLCISDDHIDLTGVDLKSTHRVLCIRKLC